MAQERQGWCAHCYRLLDKREDGRPVLHTDTRGKLCYGVSGLAISTYPGGGKPPCEWEIPATTVVTVPANPATLALWDAFYDKHGEAMRLRTTARALYRHAAGESVDADALDEAMRHGREIDEAATAAEASDGNG